MFYQWEQFQFLIQSLKTHIAAYGNYNTSCCVFKPTIKQKDNHKASDYEQELNTIALDETIGEAEIISFSYNKIALHEIYHIL